ncbi:MAG: NUDIX hydrolase [Proteobacteria bacterium]|nr:NUDIX hydrolase [Pseudomonadota bacterium]
MTVAVAIGTSPALADDFKAAGCYIEVPEGIVLAVNQGSWANGLKHLQFPVGKREPGETPGETARREVSEELGVAPEDVAVGDLLENLNAPEERPAYLFRCAVRGIASAANVENLVPRDGKESAGGIVIDPDSGTYASGPKTGLVIDLPFRFEGDLDRMKRLFPLSPR